MLCAYYFATRKNDILAAHCFDIGSSISVFQQSALIDPKTIADETFVEDLFQESKCLEMLFARLSFCQQNLQHCIMTLVYICGRK